MLTRKNLFSNRQKPLKTTGRYAIIKATVDRFEVDEMNFRFIVTAAPYGAVGDGKTNDSAAIQAAIDEAHRNGGGTVILPAGKVFLTAGLVLRSFVTLLFEPGAELLQDPDPTHYTKPTEAGYEPYVPKFGHNFSETIKWSHNWYRTYPLLFAPQGAHDFAVRGEGVIRMMEITDETKIIKQCPVGFYRCHHFEICDVHITNYHSYAVMPFTCRDGLFKNLKIDHWSHGNGDGICLMNCQNIRITGCKMFTGDDSVYIFSSYRDPRKSEWWSSDEPQPSENIEVDHNDLISHHCKAFGMILWGIDCDDLEKVEVRNVYVHDNHIETMGNWLYNPYTTRGGHPPVTTVRFENNVIDGIESNFFETKISDMSGFPCMEELLNGDFGDGRCFWAIRGDAGAVRGEENYGYAQDGAELYQGIYILKDRPCLFKAEVKTAGGAKLFVRDPDSGEEIAALDFDNAEYERKLLPFTVPQSGNYQIGLKSGAGRAEMKAVRLGSHPAAQGYQDVYCDNGKILFRYNDNLFKREGE